MVLDSEVSPKKPDILKDILNYVTLVAKYYYGLYYPRQRWCTLWRLKISSLLKNKLDTLQQITVKNKTSDNFNKKWKESIWVSDLHFSYLVKLLINLINIYLTNYFLLFLIVTHLFKMLYCVIVCNSFFVCIFVTHIIFFCIIFCISFYCLSVVHVVIKIK